MTSRLALTILVFLTVLLLALTLPAEDLGSSSKGTDLKDADSLVWASFKKVDLEIRKTYEMWSGIPLELALYFEEGFTRDSAVVLLSQRKSFRDSDPIQLPVSDLANRQGVRVTEGDSVLVLSVLMKYSGSLSQLDSLGVRLSGHRKGDKGVCFARFPIELLPQVIRIPEVTGIREVWTLAPLN